MNIQELTSSNAFEYFDGFLQTITALRPTKLNFQDFMIILNRRQFEQTLIAINEDNQVVGTLSFFIETKFIHNGGKVCHVEDVAVRKDRQRQGIGRRMMLDIETRAKFQGCYKIILDCGDQSLGFYNKCGYHKHEKMMRKDVLS